MKRLYSLLFAALISFLAVSCSENPQAPVETAGNKYPMQLNNEWNYQVEIFYTYYSENGVDSTSYSKLSWGAKVINTNEQVDTFSNVITLQLFSSDIPNEDRISYYVNNDEGLYNLYKFGGIYTMLPKTASTSNIKNNNSECFASIDPGFIGKINNVDSTRNLNRTVLKYPVETGSSFLLFKSVPDIERSVTARVNVETPVGNFECYELKGGISNLTDYISLEYGLVKRVMASDSIKTSTGYYDYKTVSTLTSVTIN